ncbi:hypothetical protein B7486_47960 [cyanobacterium TDX16]|nr:hypothetical protein B7486_47960 [cyanobacterium TDX16]
MMRSKSKGINSMYHYNLNVFNNKIVKVYSETDNRRIDTIDDVLVDDSADRIRYLIINVGFWIFGKKVILPIELVRVDPVDNCIYTIGLTKTQAKDLPEFKDNLKRDRTPGEQDSIAVTSTTTDTISKPVAPIAPVDPMTLNTVATLNEPTGITTSNRIYERS